MRGKTAFWIIVAVIAVPAVGMALFAWSIVGGVRREAAQTDARLRELAWSCLAYADEFGGCPTSEADLRGFPAPAALKAAGQGVPATRAAAASDAGATEAPAAPTLDECFESIEVEWPIARDVQPILRSKGKATLNGSLPTVGQWLFAMAEKVRKD